ncbi:MAG TPA: hypothetical protein VGR61_04665 [Candidatus Dormibacteraeota bacterium]|nr:hypothetical protein [Candidatus Dormibacteraeota bacterium]
MNIIAFIKERARYYNCPACARNLESCEVRMLKQAESHLTVEVTCARCHVTFIVVLAVQYNGEDVEETAPEPGELAGVEAAPISHDEVLDVHELLRDFDGNLKDLLRSSDPGAN